MTQAGKPSIALRLVAYLIPAVANWTHSHFSPERHGQTLLTLESRSDRKLGRRQIGFSQQLANAFHPLVIDFFVDVSTDKLPKPNFQRTS